MNYLHFVFLSVSPTFPLPPSLPPSHPPFLASLSPRRSSVSALFYTGNRAIVADVIVYIFPY